MRRRKREPWAEATPRLDMLPPPATPVVWRAFDKRTTAYLGVTVARLEFEARHRASLLYSVPVEFVGVSVRDQTVFRHA